MKNVQNHLCAHLRVELTVCLYPLQTSQYQSEQRDAWLTFVEISKMKAFVELILSSSIKTGTQSLLSVS